MNGIQVDDYLYNIKLTKLVSVADELLQNIYDLLSSEKNKELRDRIFTWRCDKQEIDDCLANRSLESLNSNLSSSESFDYDCSQQISDECILKSESENLSDDDVFSEENCCGKSLLHQKKINEHEVEKVLSYSKTGKYNPSRISESSLNNSSSFKFCRYCSNEINECTPLSSFPIDEQIEHLRKIREPVLHNCQNITKHTRYRDLENNSQLKQLFVFHEILELIDLCIEVKNDPRVMNRKIQDITNTNFFAYSTICNCLKMLTADEIRYLIIVFMLRISELRENSYPLDKLILQLDNDIVDKGARLNNLKKNYEHLKEACLSLSKKTSSKLGFSRNIPLDNICRILENSSINEPKDNNSRLLPCSVFNSKASRPPTTLLNVPSKSLCVSREGKKLVIHHNKNS